MARKRLSIYTGRLKNSLIAALFVATQIVFPLSLSGVAHAANQAANLDQWANTDNAWVNGNVGASKAAYREGDSLPYRMIMTNLTPGNHTLVIQWDTTKGGLHALDYIDTYSTTVSPDPCSGVTNCLPGSAVTTPIPTDSIASPHQTPGNLTLFGGSFDAFPATPYATSGVTTGDSSRSLTINFSTGSSTTAVLAWAGHIASQVDWNPGNSASAISGSPYHTRLISLDGAGGNQDRSLSADAVFPTPTITTQVSSSTVTVGNTVTDTATLVGPGNNPPAVTGTVNFYVCDPTTAVSNVGCPTGGTHVGSAVTIVNGSAQSATYAPATNGTYCFRAEYTPDSSAPYSPQNHTNAGSECFTAAFAPPSLTVVKQVVNNSGGGAKASSFNVQVNGTTLTGGSLSNGDATDTYTYSNPQSGTSYTVGETDPTASGYAQTSLVCKDNTAGATVANPVILDHGQNVTCTITNDDIAPRLTLVKHLSGGTASAIDWTLTATGPTTISGATGSTAVTNANVNAGQYTLSESGGPSNYSASDWSCVGGSLSGNTLTLALNDTATCSITNTRDTGTITVNKTLLPSTDSGRFNLSIGGTDNFSFTATNQGDNGTTGQKTVDTGTYTVSEAGYNGTSLSNYLSTYVCTDGQTTVASGGDTSVSNLSVAKGHNIVCTFTNTRKASISGTKYLVDADGTNEGTIQDWTIYLFVSGSQNPLYTAKTAADGSFSFTGLDPSLTYVLSEKNDSSYTQIYGNWANSICTEQSYTITLAAGENSASNDFCNFKNASISGYKFNDINGNGSWDQNQEPGLANWTVFIDANTNGQLDQNEVSTTTDQNGQYAFANLAPGTYTVCEDVNSQPGYVQTYPTTNNGCHVVTVAETGVNYTQDDNGASTNFGNQGRGHIIVDKITDPSGDPQSFDFTTTGTGYNGFSLTDAAPPNNQEVAAGSSYSVSEESLAGWDLTASSCDNHQSPNDITVGPGQIITCTFTNTKRGNITIVKDAQPDSTQAFGFTGDLGQFSLTNDGTNDGLDSQLFSNLAPDTYSVTEPNNVKGWSLDSITCTTEDGVNVNQREVNIKLEPGENITCTFVNKAIPPKLTVIKHVNNENGNNAVASDFNMNVTNTADPNDGSFPGDENGTTVTMNTGNYNVTEDQLPGYTASFGEGCTGTLDLGDEATCTITNTSNARVLTLPKTNNRPDPTVVGDTVTYTLVVTVPENSGAVFDSTVTDLPPANFTYVPGSWTATSSDRGDLKAADITTEPTYGSPGVWKLGNLTPGEVITLTYQAKIGSSVSDGTYPDLAFVSGFSDPNHNSETQPDPDVLGNLSFATTPFVSTQVSVASTLPTPTFTAGQVLGAEILVNTGISLFWLEFVLPFILIGGAIITRQFAKQGKGNK